MKQLKAWLEGPFQLMVATVDHLSAQLRIHAAAVALDAEIRSHGIVVMFCDDPWRFRDGVDRYTKGDAKTDPLLARHADPVCRDLGADNFFALVGTFPAKPMPLLLTSTASIYPRMTIRDLFTSQRLFCDDARDAPYKLVTVEGVDPFLDEVNTWVHAGTTWVVAERQRQGLGNLISRLVVMVAWLRFGKTVIGTILPNQGHERLMNVPRQVGKAICDGLDTRICMYRRKDILKDAERIAAHGITPTT